MALILIRVPNVGKRLGASRINAMQHVHKIKPDSSGSGPGIHRAGCEMDGRVMPTAVRFSVCGMSICLRRVAVSRPQSLSGLGFAAGAAITPSRRFAPTSPVEGGGQKRFHFNALFLLPLTGEG